MLLTYSVIWGLDLKDFTNYNKLYLNFGLLDPFLRLVGALGDPARLFSISVVVLIVKDLFQTIWGLNHIDFTGYYKIYPNFAKKIHFFAFFQIFWEAIGDFWTLFNKFYV